MLFCRLISTFKSLEINFKAFVFLIRYTEFLYFYRNQNLPTMKTAKILFLVLGIIAVCGGGYYAWYAMSGRRSQDKQYQLRETIQKRSDELLNRNLAN